MSEREERQTRATRKKPSERVPVGGFRDILTVGGKDPEYFYYWVLDVSENGQEIMRFQQAGYDFVQSGEVRVGEARVHATENVGSIVRQPAGEGRYLYLMKQPMEYRIEDEAAKQEQVDESEASLYENIGSEDPDKAGNKFYGSLKINK